MEDQRKVTAARLLDLAKRQNYRCAITGRELTPETASLDHIVPLSRGGAHVLSNIWLVDQKVNFAKGTMTYGEFVQLCRDVVEHEFAVAGRDGPACRASPVVNGSFPENRLVQTSDGNNSGGRFS